MALTCWPPRLKIHTYKLHTYTQINRYNLKSKVTPDLRKEAHSDK